MNCESENSESDDVPMRNKIANKSEWKQNINRKKRMEGEQYLGMSKKVFSQKPSRQLGESCSSQFCKRSALRNCSTFHQSTRKEIFSLFWKMSWQQKRLYVSGLTSISEKKKSSENSRRTQTIQYYLRHNSSRLQVCRKMFHSTLGLKAKMVRNWITGGGSHGTQDSPDKSLSLCKSSRQLAPQGKHNKKRRAFLEKWLAELPKMDSHYCRKDSKKLYFESDFSTNQEIYKLYVEDCESKKENEDLKLSYPIFAEIMKQSNYSIYRPKKDQCNLCVSHKAKNVSDEDYEEHRKEIEKMREEKKNDIENAEAGLCAVFCMDVQAVKLVPQLNASAAYYKMKLQLHNFTIYNIVTHESDNYVWDETDGNLVSSVFATCIIKHLKKFHDQSPEIHHIIIYSDGCFHQNRNTVLSNALLTYSKETNITIEQKYLISGHTQMECDATHSLIERKIKKKTNKLAFSICATHTGSTKTSYTSKSTSFAI